MRTRRPSDPSVFGWESMREEQDVPRESVHVKKRVRERGVAPLRDSHKHGGGWGQTDKWSDKPDTD